VGTFDVATVHQCAVYQRTTQHVLELHCSVHEPMWFGLEACLLLSTNNKFPSPNTYTMLYGSARAEMPGLSQRAVCLSWPVVL
jgi:hypothetical protein